MNKKTVSNNESLLKQTLLFSLPLIATGILQLLFNAADVIVVGQFAGKQALAAVGATGALINLIISLFQGLAVGASVGVAQYYGAKDERGVYETVHTSIPVSLIAGIILTFIGFFGTRTFLRWMDTPDDVIELATIYMQIYFLGVTALMVYNFGASILRAIGDTKHPLIFLVIAGVLNVILNLILVIVFKLGVAGVAIATTVSQTVSAVLVIFYLTKTKEMIRLDLKAMHIYPDKLKKILKIGIPSGLQGGLFSFSNVVIQSSVNSFGSEVMAGNTAAANIEGFIWISMNSFHQSALTFVGQRTGAREYDKIPKTVFVNIALVFTVGASMGFLAYLLRYPLLNIYLPGETQNIEYGINRMMVITVTYFTCGLMDVMTGAIRGLGNSIVPMIITVLGVCGIRLCWIFTVFQMYHTQFILYISYPISWILSFAAQLIAFLIIFGKMKKKIARGEYVGV